MPFEIVRNDITHMQVDAIVNAANVRLAPGGGVCGAIFAAAGREKLERACRSIGHCGVGQAVITSGFDLPAKYIIHTVGPVWQGGSQGEAELLRCCYLQSLRLAVRKRCRSVAFPLISSGIYGYPKGEALQIAVSAIRTFLTDEADLAVSLVIFDREALELSEGLLGRVQSYIDDWYVGEHTFSRRTQTAVLEREQQEQTSMFLEMPQMQSEDTASFDSADTMQDVCLLRTPTIPETAPTSAKRSLSDLLFHMEDSFSRMLLRLIDEKGMTDVQVYKRANLDRKLFSKLRKEGYNPSRQTAIALAIALRLNLDETKDLLSRAGYTLSRCSKFDVIIEYFITEGIYDIDEINQVLFAFDQKLLGA